jgi:hypothetical protein
VVEREVNYFLNHREHLHYKAMEEAGAPRGSGAVESLGKQLQRRLRGCGRIWSRPGFTHCFVCVSSSKTKTTACSGIENHRQLRDAPRSDLAC